MLEFSRKLVPWRKAEASRNRWRLTGFGGLVLLSSASACDASAPDEPTSELAQPASVAAASKDAPETKTTSSAAKAATVEAASVEAQALIESCRQICEKTASLSCSAHARCPDACAQSFAVPYCRAEMTKFVECTKSAGVESFECSPDGFAALKDGFCDAEQGQIVQCLERIEAQQPAP